MKRSISLLVAAAFASMISTGTLAIEPEECFLSPWVWGLASDGKSVWLADTDTMYEIDPTDGAILKDFPIADYFLSDLAYSDGSLWLQASSTLYTTLYKINPATGAVVGQLRLKPPYDFGYVYGLAAGDNALWAYASDGKIVKIDPRTGASLGAFAAPATTSYFFSGLAWDNGYLWLSDSSNGFFKLDPSSGEVLRYEPYADTGLGLTFAKNALWNGSSGSKLCRFVVEQDPAVWDMAYNGLFDNPETLELFRAYRDQHLLRDGKGRLFTQWLYSSSDEALDVLLENPELMAEAKSLIEINKGAVKEALNGKTGTIRNTEEIIAFIDAYAQEAPPRLKALSHLIKAHIALQRKMAQTFLGFVLR